MYFILKAIATLFLTYNSELLCGKVFVITHPSLYEDFKIPLITLGWRDGSCEITSRHGGL